MKNLHKNSKGFAHIGLLLLFIVVIAAIGGTGYYVFQKNHSGKTKNTSNNTQTKTASSSDQLTYVDQSTVAKTIQAINGGTSISQLEDALNTEFLEKEYACDSCSSVSGSGVAFITSDSSYKIDGKDILNDLPHGKFQYLAEADLANAKNFARLFVEEISKYPTEIGKNLPFFGFAFIKNLQINGDAAGGITSYLIYYDVSQMQNEAYARKAIHHEFAHMLDEYGLLSPGDGDVNGDSEWDSLNSSKAEYAKDYSKTLKAQTNPEHPQQGFVTQYAMTNTAEDKAETWGYIMDRQSATKLANWEKTDAVLSKKVDYLIRGINKNVPDFKTQLQTRVSLYGE